MNYYKQIKNGEIISYQTNSNKVEDESLFEITQEEYEQAIAEIIKRNEETEYITMHKTKGSSIENVIVVMDECFWKEY